MKKITDFIVDYRNIVFGIVLILAFGCVFLFDDIKINRDISKYLPDNSEVRVGKDIMEDEFKSVEVSTLNVMFKDLTKDEKKKIYKELENIHDVEVSYNDSKDYNKGKYTLYILTGNFKADSKKANKLFHKIEDKYEDYDISTSGDINEENKDVLPIYIVFLAVFCALIILIIMCDSFVEAFLFLLSIGIAVLLNKGTNIIFGHISSITDSICSILQMALSMDYSIMLISRYRQEKLVEKDNVKAMKKALFKAFTSISSSSVTTIVGLLALVFMSFTIGRDLGFVLAKGVMFSLFTIFTCLPALILMFNKLIEKTKKKTPKFNLKWLGIYSYKIRYISIIIFALIFIVSFLLKGNLTILYTDSEVDDVSRVFDTDNQMALIYNNKYEDMIAKYCKKLEKDHDVNSVLCYGNTINEKLSYNKLSKRLKDFKDDFSIDPYLLKIIYYNYFNKNEERISFNELINFIKNDVYKNKEMNSHISANMRKDIDRLENFTNSNLVNKKRSIGEISNIFDIDRDSVSDLLVYYNSLNNKNTMTINEFLNFMNGYVVNSKYSSAVSAKAKNLLKTASNFTNRNTITRKMSSTNLGQLFGIDKNLVDKIYLYNISLSNIEERLTINDFANFVLNNLASSVDNSTKEKLELLQKFSDLNLIKQKFKANEMASILGIDPNVLEKVYLLRFSESDNGSLFTIKDFVNFALQVASSVEGVDLSQLQALAANSQLMNDNKTYTATELAEFLGMDFNTINKIYALRDFNTGNNKNWEMSVFEVVNFMLGKDEIKNTLPKDSLANLNLLNFVMNSSLNNISYKYDELAKALSLPVESIKNIYSVYVSNKNITMSPQEFVTFILNHQNDPVLRQNMNKETLTNLSLLNIIMNSSLNNTRYSSIEISNIFNIDKESMDLLYSLYDIKYLNKDVSLSLKEFVDFLMNDVINNKKYNSNFTSEKITKLKTVNGIIDNSLKNTKYTKSEIFGIVYSLSNEVDRDLIDLLYIYYGSDNYYNNKWKMTIVDFVNYLNDDILHDKRFDDFIDSKKKKEIIDAKKMIKDAKKKLVGNKYSRVVLNTDLDLESKDTFKFIKKIESKIKGKDIYLIGDSSMAYNLDKTFDNELNFITILTMIFIFIVVMVTFKSILIPAILVLLIQTAVYLTMGILSFSGGTVYFIALLIVQSILMGATIDYAILYTSYYLESRRTMNMKKAIINSYNRSIHTIFTSSSILIIVTLIVGYFSSAITAKICKTISEGTICSTILILCLLPAVLAAVDKFIIKKK